MNKEALAYWGFWRQNKQTNKPPLSCVYVIWCCHFVLCVCGRSVYSKHSEINVCCVRSQVQMPAGKTIYVLPKNVFFISNLNNPSSDEPP